MKIKRLIVVILVTVIIISCLIILWHWINSFIDNKKMLGQDEIIGIFEENKECFVNIKNSMSNFNCNWAICKNIAIGSGWKVGAMKGNLYLGIGNKEYFNQLDLMKETAEKEESVKYVLKELEFREIQYACMNDYEYIDFIKQASTGNVAGILYCVRGNPTSHPYAKNIFDLGQGWYYYGTCPGDT